MLLVGLSRYQLNKNIINAWNLLTEMYQLGLVDDISEAIVVTYAIQL